MNQEMSNDIPFNIFWKKMDVHCFPKVIPPNIQVRTVDVLQGCKMCELSGVLLPTSECPSEHLQLQLATSNGRSENPYRIFIVRT